MPEVKCTRSLGTVAAATLPNSSVEGGLNFECCFIACDLEHDGETRCLSGPDQRQPRRADRQRAPARAETALKPTLRERGFGEEVLVDFGVSGNATFEAHTLVQDCSCRTTPEVRRRSWRHLC